MARVWSSLFSGIFSLQVAFLRGCIPVLNHVMQLSIWVLGACHILLFSVVEVDVKVEEPGENNVHNNAFYAEEKLLRSELEAMRDCNSLFARLWVIRNTRTVNQTGQLTGYKLLPGSNCLPLAGAEAKVLRRAAFLKHNLWVTPYARDEMFPGGEFPNQYPRVGEGLATWVKQNRSLEETDVVLWYVFRMMHVPRLEDWPIMPVEHIGFMLMLMLQPHGFFNCSPAVDVPPSSGDTDLKDNGLVAKACHDGHVPNITSYASTAATYIS